jgi:hypothetical protein
MNMSGVATGNNIRQAKEERIALGEYFQVQVDQLLSCPGAQGNVVTDIIDKACRWPVGEALAIGSLEPRARLNDSYGSKDAPPE